jgi:TadE-like protein
MVEFAIVAPLLLLLIFGVVDLGRVIYTYVTLSQAVNEGARVAIRASPPLPDDAAVEAAVQHHAADVALANPCPNGPISSALAPQFPNHGWIFITEPNPPSGVELLKPSLENAPGGTIWAFHANGDPTCSAVNPAHDHALLKVTINYYFVPITPLINQLISNNLIITATAVYRTEY